MSACRALETPQRVAYLGPAGTFSEQAALQFFGSSIEQVPCVSIDEVFRATDRRRRRLRRRAGRELHRGRGRPLARPVPAHAAAHHRRDQPARAPQPAAPGPLAGRHRGRAGASAGAGAVPRLAQQPPAGRRAARRWPAMPKARAWPRTNPTLGRPSPASAPAASSACTSSAPAIQDDPHSTARASPSSACRRRWPPPRPPGKDCVSLIVSVPNRPGAVHDILVPLKQHGVSMTRFESRPARSGQWEYYFYIDLQGHPDAAARGRGAEGPARAVRVLQGLGTYPARRPLNKMAAMFNQLGSDRLRPHGWLVRPRAQARRPGQARGRLQQVALHHRAGAPDGRDRRRGADRPCWRCRAPTSC